MERREFLKTLAVGGAALAAAPLARRVRAAAAAGDRAGLQRRIEHIIVLFQENRSFDHYFGTYRHPRGARVANLLDVEGKVDARFLDLQKNPAGVPYGWLPLPENVPGFDTALLPNLPFHLAPYIPADARVHWDPQHAHFRMLRQMGDGRMDLFVALALARHSKAQEQIRLGDTDAVRLEFEQSRPSGAVLGHYTRADIPFYHRLADEYVLCDHFFQAFAGGSTTNALCLAAARSAQWLQAPATLRGSDTPPLFDLPYDRQGMLINDLPPVQGPTNTDLAILRKAPPPAEQTYPNIGDRLSAAGIGWAWYNEHWDAVKPWALKNAFGPGDGSAVLDTGYLYEAHHNPFQYYPSWQANVRAGHLRDSNDLFADMRLGKLPAVSFVKATAAHDEHPADSTPRWGEQWTGAILRALAASPLWSKTLVVLTYDEGGGLWDHVPPPRVDAYGCGTRIPALLVSAWARRGYVDHRMADSASILKLIETRFGLAPLTARDAAAYDLLDGLDFSVAPRDPAFG